MRKDWFAIAVITVAACGKGDQRGKGGREKVDPPFAVKITKVEHVEQLAPNQTFVDQGLAKKPPDGKVYTCVFYSIENISAKEEYTALAYLVDAGGNRVMPDVDSAGRYPEAWDKDNERVSGKLAPKATAKQINCYVVPKPGATGKLLFEDTGWGPKKPPWELVVPLP